VATRTDGYKAREGMGSAGLRKLLLGSGISPRAQVAERAAATIGAPVGYSGHKQPYLSSTSALILKNQPTTDLGPGGDHHGLETDDVVQDMLSLGRIARTAQAIGEPTRQTRLALALAQQGQHGIRSHFGAVTSEQDRPATKR